MYVFKSVLTLTLLFGAFALLLSRETFHRFNRAVLVSILMVSLVLPAVHISVPESVQMAAVYRPYNDGISPIQQWYTADIPTEDGADGVAVHDEAVTTKSEHVEKHVSLPPISTCLHYIYIIGMVITLALLLRRIALLMGSLRGGLRSRDDEGNTVIVRGGDFPPFSFMHWIVMSVTDYEHHRRHILTHEQAHARLGHSWDVLLLEAVQVVQWFNPFAWLLGRELKAIHEYEADEAVICQGIDAKQYQQLLVIKAVGSRLQLLANTLNRGSLKQRINMMQRKKSSPWRTFRALMMLPVVAMVVSTTASPPTPSFPSEARLPVAFPKERGAENTMPHQADQSPLPSGGDGGGPLVEYRAHQKWGKGYRDYYLVHLPEGVWIEGNDGSYIEEQHFNYSFDNTARHNTTVMQLNGVTFDEHSLPTVSRSELKKIEIKKAEKLTVEGHAQGANLDISASMQVVNLITTPITIPVDVEGNVPRVQTLLLPGKGELYIKNGKAEPGDWMHASVTSWEKTSYDYSVRNEFEKSKTKPGYKCYIYASTETAEQDIRRAEALMRELGITNYEVVRNLPKRHITDSELRQWAVDQKAKGTAYDKLYDAMAPNHVDCADVHRQWHIVKAVYGRK